MRWFIGFIFHKIAFGLLSVLLPLYIVQTVDGGSLIAWGIITSAATFIAIPFSFIWGYLSDKLRRYRFFILLSFATVTISLYIFSLRTDLIILGILYVIIIIFQVAYEPSKNVLIAETCSHTEWKKAFASYEGWTELGWVIGLLLGYLLMTSGLNYGTLLITSIYLSFISFLASAIFVRDPTLIIERSLVSIEKSINLVQRGSLALSRLNSENVLEDLKIENVSFLCMGLVLFSLAASIFFVPLPIFLATKMSFNTSIIFLLFLFNSTGCLSGYLLIRRNAEILDAKKAIKKATVFRSLLVSLPLFLGFFPIIGGIILSAIILVSMGFVYSFYSVSLVSLSMEVIPRGKAGLLTALIGTGSAIGCFIGTLIAEKFGFQYIFIVSSICFLLSFVAFKKFK